MFRRLFLILFALSILCPSAKAVEQETKVEILHFGADWCGPCNQMKKMMKDKEVQEALKKVDYKYYDVDVRIKEKKEWQVTTIPSFIVVKDGKAKRYVGAMSKESFLKIIGK